MSTAPVSTRDLLGSERAIVSAMQQLFFGRFERLQIRNGELLLEPWPTTVREFKFGSDHARPVEPRAEEFELKRQVREFIQLVRSVESGEIRRLEIRHGLPFSMELERRSDGRAFA